MKTEIKDKAPSIINGIIDIDMFISGVECLDFLNNERLQQLIQSRLNRYSKKAVINNLSSLFLNIGPTAQIEFLLICGFDYKQLIFPAGVNEQTRSSSWDLYPHSLVWIMKFLLYSNNNEVKDNDTPGLKFGNYSNWAAHFSQMKIEEKNEFVKSLINY